MNSAHPILKFLQADKDAKHVCFLHSGGDMGKSILAQNPVDKYIGKSTNNAKKFITKHQNKDHIVIGYFSYDTAYELHNIKKTAKDDLKLPDIYLLAFDKWEEFEIKGTPTFKIPNTKHKSKNFKAKISLAQYNKAYKQIKNHIREGDIYQINLTHRLEAQTSLKSRELFLRIIKENPVDFLAYIEGDNFEILSASPERLIKIEGTKIETCPIKGTRPRGNTGKEDEKMKKELIESEKEAAELNMITDLLRNDLGKICKIGTVEVQGHRLLKKCPTVWHTYSRITGEIATNPISALISMLPGGSISGCPKKRAIQIIDKLEPHTRGIYTGTIGYFKANGDLDFNIAIRTVIKKNGKLYLQVGGGIVLDSNNEAEYEETLQKAASFMKILC